MLYEVNLVWNMPFYASIEVVADSLADAEEEAWACAHELDWVPGEDFDPAGPNTLSVYPLTAEEEEGDA